MSRTPLKQVLPNGLWKILGWVKYIEMEQVFKYKLDRRSKRITIYTSIVLALCFVFFHFITESDYLPAWLLSIAVCVIALYVLSFPRYIKINENTLEIHCLVELTTIMVEDIDIIRPMEESERKNYLVAMGSYGFGGYFGYYFNLKELNLCKIYATDRKNWILIQDIYEDTYIVSCAESEKLINAAIAARDKKREMIFVNSSFEE